MVIKIGHYGRNITPTVTINGGIKSLGTVEELGMADHRTAKNSSIRNDRSRAPVNNSVRYWLTMVIGIGHYRQNIAATTSKNGGNKSLDIIDERGACIYSIKAREYWKKTRQV